MLDKLRTIGVGGLFDVLMVGIFNAEGLMNKIVKENFRSSNEVVSMDIDGWALLNGTRKCTVMIEDGGETYSTKATLTGDGVIWNMYIEIPGLEMFRLRMQDKIKKGI